jgi:threonine dehydratase
MITPQQNYPELARAIGLDSIYLKREDLHPYGSHKGRSIPLMIDRYYAKGDRSFALSSSGNAALAAALHIQKINKTNPEPVTLDIYVGLRIDPSKQEKLEHLADEHIRVLIKENPIHALHQATEQGARSLRQSTDDVALEGYTSLAEELASIKNLGAIFIGTSSGTTAQALAHYFIQKKSHVQVHIIQTSSCHPFVDAFESSDAPDEISIAGAISDRTARRKDVLIPLIEKTGGRGWTATNDDIRGAQDFTEKFAGLSISTNSALSIAGAMKAVGIGYEIKGAVVCMVCGE